MFPKNSILFAVMYLLLVVFPMANSELDEECQSPHGEKGICRLLPNCPPLFSVLNLAPRPLPMSVVNILVSYSCGYVQNEPAVCCITKQNAIPMVEQVTTTVETTVNQLMNRDSENSEDITQHQNVKLLPFDICGTSTAEKISNGNKTGLFEFPWMAMLQYKSDKGLGLRFLCGGSLISERYVLTAAHCVTNLHDNTLVAVRLGEHDVNTEIDCETLDGEVSCADPVQNIEIEEVIPHMKFRHQYDDIALIRLSKPANMTPENVRPICLPIYNSSLPRFRFSVSGWGLTEKSQQSNELLQASVPIVPNEKCQQLFKSVNIRPSQLCAGGETGIDSCKGDSGGPLVCPGPIKKQSVRLIQFGIVSLGRIGCLSNNTFPGIYTRVGHYLKWILDAIH